MDKGLAEPRHGVTLSRVDPKINAKVERELAAGRHAGASLGGLDTSHAETEIARRIPLGARWTAGEAVGFPAGESAVTRERVTEAMASAIDEDPLVALAWCNAWGHGRNGYGVRRHNDIVVNAPESRRRLEVAIQFIRDELPLDAYYALNNRAAAHLAGLGPAFFTKFLYFVDRAVHGISSNEPGRLVPLIFDAVVARQLTAMRVPGASKRTAGWTTPEYAFYLGFADAVAGCAPERVEAELFWRARHPF